MVKHITIGGLASVTSSSVLLTVLTNFFQVLPPEINGVAAWIITTLIGVIGSGVVVIRFQYKENKTLNDTVLQVHQEKTLIIQENAKNLAEINTEYKITVKQIGDKLTELAGSIEELGSAQSTAEAIRQLAKQLPKPE